MSNHAFVKAVARFWAEGLSTAEIAKRMKKREAVIANLLGDMLAASGR